VSAALGVLRAGSAGEAAVEMGLQLFVERAAQVRALAPSLFTVLGMMASSHILGMMTSSHVLGIHRARSSLIAPLLPLG
jgi:hypothetical protein